MMLYFTLPSKVCSKLKGIEMIFLIVFEKKMKWSDTQKNLTKQNSKCKTLPPIIYAAYLM